MGRPKKLHVGVQIGHWLLLRDAGKKSNGTSLSFYTYWECKCTLCDRVQLVREYNLKKRLTSHCTRCNPGRPQLNPSVEVGQVIGWWTVVEQVENALDTRGRKSHRRFKCRCRCGKIQILRQTQLNRQGKSTSGSLSCGCGRSYHAAVTMMLKHENILSPSVKKMFAEFRTTHERKTDGSDREHASTSSDNLTSAAGVVPLA